MHGQRGREFLASMIHKGSHMRLVPHGWRTTKVVALAHSGYYRN